MDRNAPMTFPEVGLLDFIGCSEVRQCKIYYCTRVKLFHVYIESLTVSFQPLKKKSKDKCSQDVWSPVLQVKATDDDTKERKRQRSSCSSIFVSVKVAKFEIKRHFFCIF